MKNGDGMKKGLTLIFFWIFAISFSQNDSINRLDEIVLQGSFSPTLSSGYTIEILQDSILQNNVQSLGNVLQSKSNLYFKQYGNGMLSSIALRGTNASQTGVYWNGIAINSSLNGQTDFNSLTTSGLDKVEIRKGGSSVLLGSGAIGGAINLSDKVVFEKKESAIAQVGIGSYHTYQSQLQTKISNKRLFAKISVGDIQSKNDYPYLGTDLINENGEFKNFSANGVIAYKFNDKNRLTYFTSFVDNDRNLSATITAPSNAKMKNAYSRNLINWQYLGTRFTSSLKTAYIAENYTYYSNQDRPDFSEGSARNLIVKYDLNYFINNSMFLNAGVGYKNEQGWGTNIVKQNQDIVNTYLLFHHQPIEKLNYNISIRKGNSNVFTIPFIYAVDARYNLSKHWAIKAAYSTNYRNPTFNDLYWEGGGNPDLKSETSTSGEMGFVYKHKIFAFEITPYFIKSKDLIQWRPVSGTIWQPINIQNVNNYGLEVSGQVKKKINDHVLHLKIQYDYNQSEDVAIGKQLIYVPIHKANGLFTYRYKQWGFTYNLQYTGEVFTTTSNTQFIDPYLLSNIDFNRSLLKNKLQIIFRINNLFDASYQSIAYRPMPNRNFTLNINFKI